MRNFTVKTTYKENQNHFKRSQRHFDNDLDTLGYIKDELLNNNFIRMTLHEESFLLCDNTIHLVFCKETDEPEVIETLEEIYTEYDSRITVEIVLDIVGDWSYEYLARLSKKHKKYTMEKSYLSTNFRNYLEYIFDKQLEKWEKEEKEKDNENI